MHLPSSSPPLLSQSSLKSGSFELEPNSVPERQGSSPALQDSTESAVSLNVSRSGYFEKLINTLVFFGWLPTLSPGGCRHMRFMITIALDLLVVVTAAQGGLSGSKWTEAKLLYFMSSMLWQILTLSAHLGMYCVGGKQLSLSLQTYVFFLPHAHFLVLAIFASMQYLLDLTLLYAAVSALGFANVVVIRRVCIMLQRLPDVLSKMVVCSLPEKLCQDLVHIRRAIDAGDLFGAQCLYCAFWRDLRIARSWYNMVATSYFIISIIRIPIVIYVFSHWIEHYEGREFEMNCLFAGTAIDAMQMTVWIKPAIDIRRLHSRIMRASVEAARQRTESNTAFATMVASLHPLVGMKMLGFLVTWRLVTQVTAFITLALTGLRLLLEREVKS